MPNWCSTRINFYGDKTALSDLHDKTEKYTSSSIEKSDFKNSWLGNIVLGFGLTYDGDNGVGCRGSLDCLDETNENGEFSAFTETASVPMIKMWEKIIEKHYSDSDGNPLIFFDWLAEELGCGLYCTNNIEAFAEKYRCDFCIDDDYETFYFDNEKDVIETANEFFKKHSLPSIATIDEINSFEADDSYMIVNVLEEVDNCYFD